MTLRLIHVGVGGRGTWPLRLAPARNGLASVALVDVDPLALAAARALSGVGERACFRALDEALATVEADAVVIVTPPHLHVAHCLAAVRAGKHVLVEKPLALRLEDARAIVREADAHGVTVTVCQNARYFAAYTTIRRIVREGSLGRPVFGMMTRYGARPDVRHSGAMRHAYLWERGIHDFDTVLALLDARPLRVSAQGFNPPWSPYAHGAGVHAWAAFEGGATCGWLCTFAAHKPGASLRLELEGGTLELLGEALLLRRAGSAEDERIPLDAAPPAEEVILDAFCAHATGGVEPEICGRANLITVAMVEAAAVASDEGRVVDLATL